MGYGKQINEEARRLLEERKFSAEREADRRLQGFFDACPRGREIREELSLTGARTAKAVLRGGNVREELERLRERSLSLKTEYISLLREHGLTEEDVSPRYSCPDCGDTGIADGKICHCLKALRRKIAYERLSMCVPLSECTFDGFSLSYYENDPQALRQMENILRVCREYAARFRAESPSLLFRGGTGLGKTHLALAIAGEATEKGFGVLYGSAQTFAAQLERERFQHPENELEDTGAQMTSCDLLILDDLGTEFSSSYVGAVLYNILDTRMLSKKPTIITTNLSFRELEKRYGERFASRIVGYYGRLEFLGSDVRYQKERIRREKSAARRGETV